MMARSTCAPSFHPRPLADLQNTQTCQIPCCASSEARSIETSRSPCSPFAILFPLILPLLLLWDQLKDRQNITHCSRHQDTRGGTGSSPSVVGLCVFLKSCFFWPGLLMNMRNL